MALTKNGEVILGVVYDPFENRLYSAKKGEGSYLNGEKIHVSKESQLRKVTGSYEVFKRAKYDTSKLLEVLVNKDIKLMQLCSIVYPSVLIATGEIGFTIFPNNTVHDAAAVKIIVEEAGGKVTDIFGREQKYDKEINGFIASNGILHEKLVKLSKKFIREY